jgi:2-haloacid dehalogenase
MGRYADFWVVTGDALEHVCARLGLALSESGRSRLMQGWLSLEPYADVDQGLATMAPRPLAVLSNGSPEMLEESLRRSNLRSRFAHVLSVAEVSTYKPDPAVYELAERHLSLSRDRILFVSANGWDAAGASSFGLRVAWVNRLGQAHEALPGTPELVVPDLVALGERLPAATP